MRERPATDGITGGRGVDERREPLGGRAALADLHERAGERPHHAAQEGIGVHRDRDSFEDRLAALRRFAVPKRGAIDAHRGDVTHRAATGARRASERGEIMRPNEVRRRGPHRVDVEWAAYRPRVATHHRRPAVPAHDEVAVRPLERVAARIEAVMPERDAAHRKVGGERRVERVAELVGRPAALERAADDLSVRVGAGVGAPRRGERGSFGRDGAERVIEDAHRGPHARLDLPAGEIGAVVLEGEAVGGHG